MSKLVKWQVNTGFAACVHKGEFHVSDGTTEDEINEMVRDEMFNRIDYNFQVVDEEAIDEDEDEDEEEIEGTE